MADPIATIFGFCVWVLQVIGGFTGWGYQLANIIVFIIVQPGLILLFFVLWRRARREALEYSFARMGCDLEQSRAPLVT